MAEKNTPTIEDLKAPLFAAVGAADLALERVNEIIAALRDRVEDARTDATDRVEETRGRLTKLQDELPERAQDIRGRLSGDELRRAAEGYREQATELYNDLIARGEAVLERLRSQPGFEERRALAEKRFSEAAELTQEALGNVASQTRAVGERAAKLIGRDVPKKAAKKVPAKKTTAKKATAKKAIAKKAPAKKGAAKRVTQK
ncbi:heparin-binding hemagglutinin [Mycobacterium sp.]|uniref:heparin-binding hemagglutinin n=1 Tax=Mycobacterium sp. TaxID=1785 RepID=UPI003C71016E